jgi:5-methylcytosine-specific restriction enzyme subunit McrC
LILIITICYTILHSAKVEILTNEQAKRRIVIDTKFTSIVTKGWHREESLRSGYVYQIYAYLRSQVGNGDVLANQASGLLLHPAIGEMVDEAVIIQGHSIRFATVDLGETAEKLRAQLLKVVGIASE